MGFATVTGCGKTHFLFTIRSNHDHLIRWQCVCREINPH
jgi:hypothetical protein